MDKESRLIYSFRTNKNLGDFKRQGIEIFVFGKLKENLETLKGRIQKDKPKLIIGLAEVRGKTCVEPVAINRFGKNRKISGGGCESYSLEIPSDNPFEISQKPTQLFCNWTMYSIKELIGKAGTKFIFIHYNSKDLDRVINFIKHGIK